MEPTARFDVTLAIEDWLQTLRRQRRFRHDDREELRSHLLDLTDDLVSCGLSSEQAFQAAIRQLGDVDTLASEFGKVNRWYVWRQKALAAGRLAVSSKRAVAFSLIFVAITFGSIFGQKPSEKRRENQPKSRAEKRLHPKDTLPQSTRNNSILLKPVP